MMPSRFGKMANCVNHHQSPLPSHCSVPSTNPAVLVIPMRQFFGKSPFYGRLVESLIFSSIDSFVRHSSPPNLLIILHNYSSGFLYSTTRRKIERPVKFFLTFHGRILSFSASVQTLPNPQGESVLCRIDVGMVRMIATNASEFRLYRAILLICCIADWCNSVRLCEYSFGKQTSFPVCTSWFPELIHSVRLSA